jgi:hypothetical protein
MAMLRPPPMQKPWIMASSGFCRCVSESWPRAEIWRYCSSSAMLRRRSLNWEMSAPDTNAASPAPRRMTTRMASSVARSSTYFGISSHISWLTALRFSGWLNTIQPIGPSFSSSSFGVSLMSGSLLCQARLT